MIFLAPVSEVSPPQSDPEFYSVTSRAAGVGQADVRERKRGCYSAKMEPWKQKQNHLSASQGLLLQIQGMQVQNGSP